MLDNPSPDNLAKQEYRSKENGDHYPLSQGVRIPRGRPTHTLGGPIKIKNKGGLNGWYHAQPEEQRHRELEETVRKSGYEETEKRLNALTVLDKFRNPRVAEIASQDKHWLEGQHANSAI